MVDGRVAFDAFFGAGKSKTETGSQKSGYAHYLGAREPGVGVRSNDRHDDRRRVRRVLARSSALTRPRSPPLSSSLPFCVYFIESRDGCRTGADACGAGDGQGFGER